jgi:hypothetical protein
MLLYYVLILGVSLAEVKNVEEEVELGHYVVKSLHNLFWVLKSQHLHAKDILLACRKERDPALRVQLI